MGKSTTPAFKHTKMTGLLIKISKTHSMLSLSLSTSQRRDEEKRGRTTSTNTLDVHSVNSIIIANYFQLNGSNGVFPFLRSRHKSDESSFVGNLSDVVK